MDLVLALLLLAASLVVLAYPLYQSRAQAVLTTGGTLSDLLAQRDGLYATLRDLDLDYELGKLDIGDYNARREKYLSRAALVLHQLDELRGAYGREVGLSDDIERQIAALRRQAPKESQETAARNAPSDGPSGAAVGTQASDPRARRPTLICPNCGRAYNEGDRFCARCGHTLT